MRRAGIPLLAVIYGATAVAVAVWAALIAEFHCYNVSCRASGSDWAFVQDAWQWDAITWLAPLSGLAGLVTLVIGARSRRPLPSTVSLGVHAALLVPTLVLLVGSNHFSPFRSVFWCALVLGTGGALIYFRNARQIEGTRRE